MSPTPCWQFWIDVGGTFTDCLAVSPTGEQRHEKLLSSGVIRSQVGPGSTRERIADQARGGEPPGFWDQARLELLDAQGQVAARATVAKFDPQDGLWLQVPLPVEPEPGQLYQLHTGQEAPVLAVRRLLGLGPQEPLPELEMKLGTTRGTNALLTRTGAPTAFVTTCGFADVLRIGYQNRPRLFELTIRKPEPLFSAVAELPGRIDAQGRVLEPLSPPEVQAALEPLRRQGIRALAVALLHAYANPEHELLVGQVAGQLGFEQVSLSHQVAAHIKLVSRGDTTVVDAYLTPVLRDYLGRIRRQLGPRSTLRVMTSAGGLVQAEDFSGKDSVLSGPAGGVVGAARVARAAGIERIIGFDMGGTSTDVSRYDGHLELEYETEKAGVRIVTPMLAIHTVAAGGGSLCRFDGTRLLVGPQSAGADPGPACYGAGGPLAVTDVNYYLGRVPEEQFPFPLNRRAVEERLQQVAQQVRQATGRELSLEELCEGFRQVAGTNMAEAIRAVSLARGYDPRDYCLVPFGGAAGQHCCQVAGQLGIGRILVPRHAGVLSALGVGCAQVVRHRSQGVYRPLEPGVLEDLRPLWQRLTQEALEQVEQQGVPRERIEAVRWMDLRYRGLEAWLTLPEPADGDWAAAYHREHQRLFGYHRPEHPLEVVALRVEAVGQVAPEPEVVRPLEPVPAQPQRFHRLYHQGSWHQAGLFAYEELRPGHLLRGPAIVLQGTSTLVVDPQWEAQLLPNGDFLLQQEGTPARPVKASAEAAPAAQEPDPVLLEVFNRRFTAIAQQMGITLRQTASSVNVKERLDYSCALFTARGELVVNAPHIPVYLGAMSQTVQAILRDNPDIRPGDVFLTNDHYRGGSHLPDLTVVTPVHDQRTGRLVFFTASRAHHAEIGGVSPGSMPPFSRHLGEEGVVIRNFKLLEAGEPRFDQLRQLLSAGPYPSRAVEDNLADLAAQVAANRRGAQDLWRLIDQYGLEVVLRYMQHIQQAAETRVRQRLEQMPDGTYRFEDHLDDGTPIHLAITVRGSQAVLDFSGTGPVHPGNLNANPAIVTAAVLYCLRCLLDEDVPMNQGMLRPMELKIPPGVLNPPEADDPAQSPAVAGGNVETSQRVVDVILGAWGLAAASQWTMNNLLFGDSSFGYYETICGGAGATPQGPGADAVHTHMTNTRLTDVEVLEHRYPVQVVQFSIRRSSGGRGKHRGGDGVVRKLRFLRPLTLTLVTQRRGLYRPYGLAGGEPGAAGQNLLHRLATGDVETLGSLAQVQVNPGDVLELCTPGGGGWGTPE